MHSESSVSVLQSGVSPCQCSPLGTFLHLHLLSKSDSLNIHWFLKIYSKLIDYLLVFSWYFSLWKHFKVFLLRTPTDGSLEVLQCSQNPLLGSLLSFSFSHLCELLCTIAPQIWLGSSRHLHFYHISLFLLRRLAWTSEVLFHLCLSLCPGMAAEVFKTTQYFVQISAFLSSTEGFWMCIIYYAQIYQLLKRLEWNSNNNGKSLCHMKTQVRFHHIKTVLNWPLVCWFWIIHAFPKNHLCSLRLVSSGFR